VPHHVSILKGSSSSSSPYAGEKRLERHVVITNTSRKRRRAMAYSLLTDAMQEPNVTEHVGTHCASFF
jgi:hypothetical protein